MVRIVLTDEAAKDMDRAVNLLGPKILAYSKTEHWLVVSRADVDAAVVALEAHRIAAVAESWPPAPSS